MLFLRGFTVGRHSNEPSLPSTVVQASVSAAKSISFPGMAGAGRLSVSPSSAGASASTRPSALTKVMDTPEPKLPAQERVVFTWNLQRRRDWGEVKRRLVYSQETRDWEGLVGNLALPLPKQREGPSVSRETYRNDGVSANSSLSASRVSISMMTSLEPLRTSGTTETRRGSNVFMIFLRWVFWVPNRKRRSSLLLRMVRVSSGMTGKGGSIGR